ncbi:imelysin family protein [Rhodobium gokarnense]|uniref:Iron-regulated protein n=1 Tax=Rhodobium gokarnense TaxID=364296 RepID=A0ABT3HFE2_9HYPH|nr:imelysin family protein [Rhodobium gokarnense]MCW2309123.1 putative iron-regulated protein [Rhodobium gokarnense]
MISPAAAEVDKKAVLDTYADIAEAGYEDSLAAAKTLDAAIDKLIADPSEETLAAAKDAWRAARIPYQQTEAFRFGNPIVDDWEGKVNAWPLDEGLIDYVKTDTYGMESDENELFTANVIANETITIGGKEIDTSKITPELLGETLHEAGEVEANVATGYHAIEFLLWGQDVNGTDAGAGTRPATDFDTANCTGGHCDRRAAYLKAASTLMISDLEEIVAAWSEGGAAREDVMDADGGIVRILTGMGSLSYGELAGERMKLGLLLHDPEEEHDCFSDNTHMSHFLDAKGISNVYHGKYTRIDGSVVEGASLSDLVAEKNADLDKELSGKLEATMAAMTTMKERAEGGEAYDQMIGEGNDEGNAVVQAAIDALVDQTRSIERVVAELDLDAIDFEGSDSLDNPNAVFQ